MNWRSLYWTELDSNRILTEYTWTLSNRTCLVSVLSVLRFMKLTFCAAIKMFGCESRRFVFSFLSRGSSGRGCLCSGDASLCFQQTAVSCRIWNSPLCLKRSSSDSSSWQSFLKGCGGGCTLAAAGPGDRRLQMATVSSHHCENLKTSGCDVRTLPLVLPVKPAETLQDSGRGFTDWYLVRVNT